MIGALLSVPALSAAQPSSPPPSSSRASAADDSERERHRAELIKGAYSALLANRMDDALRAWREAYAIRPDPRTACNIGMAEHLRHKEREAAIFLAECLSASPTPSAKEQPIFDKFRAAFTEARAELGVVELIVGEAGARVSVDGEKIGALPTQEIFVEPGARRFSVESEGYEQAEQTITIRKGEIQRLSIKLKRIESKPAPKPPPPAPLIPLVSASSAMVVKPIAPIAAKASPSPILAIGGAVLSAVGAGFGIGFRLASDNSEAEQSPRRAEVRHSSPADCTSTATDPACSAYASALHTEIDFERAATATFVGAGTVAAATIAYVLLPHVFAKPKMTQSGSVLVVKQW